MTIDTQPEALPPLFAAHYDVLAAQAEQDRADEARIEQIAEQYFYERGVEA
jgi:hypothetical protein